MDFDDLDDEIEQRIADGDTEGLDNFAFEKKILKDFEEGRYLPPLPTSDGLYTTEGDTGEARVRAFLFYGPGDKAEDFKSTINSLRNDKPWLQVGVYEWPGHGAREGEEAAEDIQALGQDALTQLSDAFEQVKEDAEYEGAPFAFIGRSVGCQIMTQLAKQVLVKFGMAPCAAIVMDRAPLQFPLLSEEGQELLQSDPDKVVEAFNYDTFAAMDKAKWAKDVVYASETKDQFFHKYECDMLLLKGAKDKSIDELGTKSKYKMTQLKVKGKDEYFQMPVESKTTVKELMTAVSSIFAITRGTELTAFGSDGNALADTKIVEDSISVEGLDDFKHPHHTWPHPVCIIGAGFYGVKMAMAYHLHKNYNIIMFDRHPQAGGDAWHLSATKYSRCQTDFGAFNIWYGLEFNTSGDGGYGTEKGGRSLYTKAFQGPGSPLGGSIPSGAGTGVDYHPVRHQILEGMRYAFKEYNVQDFVHFQTEVASLEINGDPEWEGRSYKLGVKSLKDPPEADMSVKVSVVAHFPGAYDITRIVDYPGEEEFTKAGGQIGYGMGNGQGGEFLFHQNMVGGRVAILGNGAFAVENVRSCMEEGASKVYIVTRRKSLLCPRLPCWFCHQGPDPTPAGLLLDMFRPMYEIAGLEDPWTFYAVHKVGKRDARIEQSSRFGIGDVTFLCHNYGLLEYRVDTVARFSAKTIHLTGGEKLEDMNHCCKALGLLGDVRVDKLHGMTHRLGNMINGDWRRVVTSDATGMDAQRFTTFSAGPGAYNYVRMWHWLHTHPWAMYEAMKKPEWKMMPKHQLNDKQPDQPCYQVNVQYEMHAGNVFANCMSEAFFRGTMVDEGSYKYSLIHTMHPTEKFIEYCKADWDRYQDLIHDRNPGFKDVPRAEYPYTYPMVKKWFDEYTERLPKFPITPDGPSPAVKEACISNFQLMEAANRKSDIPHLIRETKYLPNLKPDEDALADALAGSVYKLKKNLTASKEDSALDFDDDQYDEWKEAMSSDYTFTSKDIDSFSKDLLSHPLTWAEILTCLESKK